MAIRQDPRTWCPGQYVPTDAGRLVAVGRTVDAAVLAGDPRLFRAEPVTAHADDLFQALASMGDDMPDEVRDRLRQAVEPHLPEDGESLANAAGYGRNYSSGSPIVHGALAGRLALDADGRIRDRIKVVLRAPERAAGRFPEPLPKNGTRSPLWVECSRAAARTPYPQERTMGKTNRIAVAAVALAASMLGTSAFSADYPAPRRGSDPNRLQFDKRGDWGTTEIDVRGSGVGVEAVILGDHADTTLEVSGRGLGVEHYQFGPSAYDGSVTGSNGKSISFGPACATAEPQHIHVDGRLKISIPSCQ